MKEWCQCYRCRRKAAARPLCTQKDCVICPDVGKTCQDREARELAEALRKTTLALQELGYRIVVGRVEDFGAGHVEIVKETKI